MVQLFSTIQTKFHHQSEDFPENKFQMRQKNNWQLECLYTVSQSQSSLKGPTIPYYDEDSKKNFLHQRDNGRKHGQDNQVYTSFKMSVSHTTLICCNTFVKLSQAVMSGTKIAATYFGF